MSRIMEIININLFWKKQSSLKMRYFTRRIACLSYQVAQSFSRLKQISNWLHDAVSINLNWKTFEQTIRKFCTCSCQCKLFFCSGTHVLPISSMVRNYLNLKKIKITFPKDTMRICRIQFTCFISTLCALICYLMSTIIHKAYLNVK